jgi:hypothetical protein
MARDLAIILSDGGINGAIATALAQQRYRLVMLRAERTTDQPPIGRRVAYDHQVSHFKPYREHVVTFTGLVSDRLESDGAADPRQPSLLTPRLLEMLPAISAAAQYAAHYHATAIFLGLRIGPDTDELAQATEYIQIWNELIQLACARPEIQLNAPLLELEPWQAIDLGFQVDTPFERTWSCTEGAEQPCWACRACRERIAAFQRSAHPDPLRIKK